jgi:hypothetical protein
MKKIIFGSILIVLLGTIISFADNISAPPPLIDSEPSVSYYFKQIYDNFHRLQVVTVNPDGVRSGKKGDMVLLQTGGNSYLEINSDSGTTWLGVLLSNTP